MMKKVYAVLRVSGQGKTEPLEAYATDQECALSYRFERIETFNSREAAADRARELVRVNPASTYHVVESVQALYSNAPVTTHTF